MRSRAKMRLSAIILRPLSWQLSPRSSQFASFGLYSNLEMRRNRKPVPWGPAWPLSFAFQGSALSGWAAVSRGLAVNLIDLRRLIQKNMNLVGNAFSIRSDLLFVLPARGTLSFVMENFEHPCKTRQSHLTSTHAPKRTNKKIFNAWLHYQIAGYLGYYN